MGQMAVGSPQEERRPLYRNQDLNAGEKGMPQGGAKQLRRLRCIVSLIILYIHIIGEP